MTGIPRPVAGPPVERVVLGTHDGPLACARADAVAAELRRAWDGLLVEVRVVPAEGGRSDVAGSETAAGTSVDALRAALHAGRVDVAVHGFSELPVAAAPGLAVGAVPMRADPRDVLITRTGKVLTYLPAGTRIAAGTPGRGAQLLRRRADLVVVPTAGDVRERLARLGTGDYDAVVLSAAALDQLGLLDRVTEYFDTDQLIPAPAQGALALEVRSGDGDAVSLVAPLHDELSAYAITAERTCLARLGARTDVPIGVFAVTDGDRMFIHGIVGTPDGTRSARLRWTGPWRQAEEVGATLAELLLSAGGREILSGQSIPPTTNYAERRRRELVETWDEPYPPEEA